MPQKDNRGGPGRNQGRKRKGNALLTWQDYERISIPKPANDREADALEWFKSREPFERLQLITRFYYGETVK